MIRYSDTLLRGEETATAPESSLKMWHLMASNLVIHLRMNHWPQCLSKYWSGSRRVYRTCYYARAPRGCKFFYKGPSPTAPLRRRREEVREGRTNEGKVRGPTSKARGRGGKGEKRRERKKGRGGLAPQTDKRNYVHGSSDTMTTLVISVFIHDTL